MSTECVSWFAGGGDAWHIPTPAKRHFILPTLLHLYDKPSIHTRNGMNGPDDEAPYQLSGSVSVASSRDGDTTMADASDEASVQSAEDNAGLSDDNETEETVERRPLLSRSIKVPLTAKECKSRSLQRKARLSGKFRSEYRALLDAEIENIISPCDGESVNFGSSVLGASHWSSTEKSMLFAKLPLLGPHDTAALSRFVGTKSEAEVQAYLQLLLEGAVEDHATTAKSFGIELDEIPAAVEISPACEAKLEDFADKIASMEVRRDEELEKECYGDQWLLSAAMVQRSLRESPALDLATDVDGSTVKRESHNEGGEHGLSESATNLPALAFFNLSGWLDLEMLFMSADAAHQETWVDFIESQDERPAIYHSAFGEFHSIATDLTKKLMQATIGQASSRHRANHRVDAVRSIRAHDVRAACEMLRLGPDWDQFWIGAARRLQLDVWTRGKRSRHGSRNGNSATLSYDQVEAFLRSQEREIPLTDEDVRKDPNTPTMDLEDDDEFSDVSYESDFWTETETEPESQLDEINVGQAVSKSGDGGETSMLTGTTSDTDEFADVHTGMQRNRDRSKAEDAFLEAFDRQASKVEEQELQVMMLKPKDRMDKAELSVGTAVHDTGLPVRPARKRKRHEDLANWRQRVDWVPPWEAFETLPTEDDFKNMGKRGASARDRRLKRRRTRAEAVLKSASPVGDDSDVHDGEGGAHNTSSDSSS